VRGSGRGGGEAGSRGEGEDRVGMDGISRTDREGGAEGGGRKGLGEKEQEKEKANGEGGGRLEEELMGIMGGVGEGRMGV